MGKVERVGISLESELLCAFDKVIAGQGYQNRSEAVRDLIRDKLSQRRLANPKTNAIAAVCLVYNHHSTKLLQKLASLQHCHHLHTIASMHIHLDRHDCLEIVTLKGKVSQINKMADEIVSLKGVKLGKVNLVTTENDKT
jgi:CopG family nickel-responsive transcriptional regulator